MYKRGFIIFGVVSLTMGNSGLPLAHCLARHLQLLGKLFLGQAAAAAQKLQSFSKSHILPPSIVVSWYQKNRALSINLEFPTRFFSRNLNLRLMLSKIPSDFSGKRLAACGRKLCEIFWLLGLFASIIQDSGVEHHCFLAGRKSFSRCLSF